MKRNSLEGNVGITIIEELLAGQFCLAGRIGIAGGKRPIPAADAGVTEKFLCWRAQYLKNLVFDCGKMILDSSIVFILQLKYT